jgi:hypothetical protein
MIKNKWKERGGGGGGVLWKRREYARKLKGLKIHWVRQSPKRFFDFHIIVLPRNSCTTN